MADRHESASSVGELLRNMALRSGSAFPDFDAAFRGERMELRRGRLILALGMGLVLACTIAVAGWSKFIPANPLIESWDGTLTGVRVAADGTPIQDPLVSYLEVLWNASSDTGGTPQ